MGYAFRAEYANSATEADPEFNAWDKSTGVSITESQISDLSHFTTADEIDPRFTAWDKSTGVSITESQISDLSHFTAADEEDPVWTGVSGKYYTTTNMQTSGQSQLHWDNLASVPTGFADGVDDTGVDDLWTAGTGDAIYHENGNVGIGDTDVTSKLKVTNLDETQSALLMQQQAEYNLFLEATGGTGNDRAESVSETSDGGYIVAGYTQSYGAGNSDVFLLKYDSGGNLTWSKTVGEIDEEDEACSVSETSDGGFIVAGFTGGYGAGGYDVLLLRTDGNGDITGCAPCASVSPSESTPTPSTDTPSPSTDAPSPSTSVVCAVTGGSTLQDVLVVTNDARVGIGTTSPPHLLHVDGVARSAQSTWATSSDRRVKTDIRPLSGSLDKIRRLYPVTFEYIPAYRGDNEALAGRKTGFIAQEVARVDPGMVSTVVETFGDRTMEDFRTLNTGNMIPMLVDALKEQQEQIGKLKSENEGSKAEKSKEIGELKQVVCELKPDAAICR